MNRRLIPILILLISTQINAVQLSSNGMGQVLIFPYYTVNGGFNTLINLVNTTSDAKALRVRFREAANGREVFTFNLYLAPHDVWTGGLVKTDEGQGFLTKLIVLILHALYLRLAKMVACFTRINTVPLSKMFMVQMLNVCMRVLWK